MAAIASFPSSLLSHCTHTKIESLALSSSYLSFSSPSSCCLFSSLRLKRIAPVSRSTKIKAVAEDETLAPEAEAASEAEEESSPSDQTVSVPVSPSDLLTMFFKAEGTMDESATTKVSKALEEIEGVSDLNVQVAEGIATVELTKQTTIQATGVASNLVEVIQGSGFKLQYLHLSFEDEEDVKS